MKTVALRFGEHFAPNCGTIAAHQEIIDHLGFVWYGKLGGAVSENVRQDILKNEHPRILLINSGKFDRYWAHISEIKRETPNLEEIPAYYRHMAKDFKTWFKVNAFETASRDIMSKCVVSSSKSPLTEASKHSMSPYFIIEYNESECSL